MADAKTALATVPATGAISSKREDFNLAARTADALSRSTLVPAAYRGRPENVLVAYEYANRLGASILAVMQNLDVIEGKPGLRSTFLIGTVNASRRFSPLRFRWQGEEGSDEWGARAYATDLRDNEECVGPLVTIGTAKTEGWYGRKGSKWKTIPELMIYYRAAAWWTRIYCPDLALGLHTADELDDMGAGQAAAEDHSARVLAALRAEDMGAMPDPAPEGGEPVREAEIVGDEEKTEEPTGEGADPNLDRLRGQYFAMLAERLMDGDEDRRAFQRRLHANGFVTGESAGGWGKQDFREAIAELTAIPVEPEA